MLLNKELTKTPREQCKKNRHAISLPLAGEGTDEGRAASAAFFFCSVRLRHGSANPDRGRIDFLSLWFDAYALSAARSESGQVLGGSGPVDEGFSGAFSFAAIGAITTLRVRGILGIPNDSEDIGFANLQGCRPNAKLGHGISSIKKVKLKHIGETRKIRASE